MSGSTESDPVRDAGFAIVPIGYLETPFAEKFGVPRQSGMVPAARGRLTLLPQFADGDALRGLEGFSHVWLITLLNQIPETRPFRATVRPPRLGGDVKLGVFATRSGFRPNRLGLSLVALDSIDLATRSLSFAGVDLVDGTPVFDVKPYLPWVESVPEARAGFAARAPVRVLDVVFSERAEEFCGRVDRDRPDFRGLISALLEFDPRPRWSGEDAEGKTYGFRLYDVDVRWHVEGAMAIVDDILVDNSENGGESRGDA